MGIIVKEEVPIKPRRETPGIPGRRLPSVWIVAVVVALVMGLVAGAAVWQATRGTSAAESTGKATAATRALATRYVAAGLWSMAQFHMFAPNAVWIDVQNNNSTARGFGLQAAYTSGWLPNTKNTQRLVVAGPNGFVTQWTQKGSHSPITGRPFTVRGVSVSQVNDGKIVRQSIYYDARSLYSPPTG